MMEEIPRPVPGTRYHDTDNITHRHEFDGLREISKDIIIYLSGSDEYVIWCPYQFRGPVLVELVRLFPVFRSGCFDEKKSNDHVCAQIHKEEVKKKKAAEANEEGGKKKRVKKEEEDDGTRKTRRVAGDTIADAVTLSDNCPKMITVAFRDVCAGAYVPGTLSQIYFINPIYNKTAFGLSNRAREASDTMLVPSAASAPLLIQGTTIFISS
jgi:hypothetical protein